LNTVLIDWFIIRFSEKTPKEVLNMFALQDSLEHTVAYKELVGIGIAKSKEMGITEGKEIRKVETLEELHAEGIIPEKFFQKRYKKYQVQLAELLKK
jgi:predicted transposase YdaD